jgi:serine/threonine-protein phosphatase 2B regulatory subunit
MGNEASYQMGMATNFDAEEIKRLGKRFKKLDLVKNQLILHLLTF